MGICKFAGEVASMGVSVWCPQQWRGEIGIEVGDWQDEGVSGYSVTIQTLHYHSTFTAPAFYEHQSYL